MALLDKVKSKLDKSGGGGSGGASAQAAQQLPSAPPSLPLGPESVIRYRQQRGVNLGAWFCLEKWIVGKPFEGAKGSAESDYDIACGDNAKATLEQHWDSWITEEDWQWIVKQGFNAVRLPIGYYHLCAAEPAVLLGTDFEPHADTYSGAWPRIQAAIDKAGQLGLGVLVDLHAAPGAQNEDAHAGLSKKSVGLWNKGNLGATRTALRFLASHLAPIPHVIGLELLNEPKNNGQLEGWYNETIAACREVAGPDFPLYIGDGWDTQHYAGFIGKQSTFVVLDHHLYRCFTPEDGRQSGDDHAKALTGGFGEQFAGFSSAAHRSIVVGEFSASLSPSSFGGNGDAGEQDRQRRVFLRAQLDLFERHCAGYFFWTLKKREGWDAGWSAKDAARAEILPGWVGGKRFQPGSGDGRKDEMFKGAYDSHVGYWDSKGKDFEHDRFSAGLEQGWQDAQIFFNYKSGSYEGTSQLGFVHEWMARRRAEHVQAKGDGKHVWEFEHGFKQGAAMAAEAYLS